MTIQTDSSALTWYIDAGWQLIPLLHYQYFDQHKGKRRERGKSPQDANWTTKHYNSAAQISHMDAGNNVGVRLRATDLVIDVDPRNFKEGDDPFTRLCEDCNINPDDYPVVNTGSGGIHVYMTKPDEVSVRDSLPDYEGVEFKTIGRQVVSAGSIHPTTHKLYEWDLFSQKLSDVVGAPQVLINMIRRPDISAATGGGEHNQEELAKMLDVLDPENFRDHSDWLTLMQACHHATAGDGRSEFIEWSTRDPQYQNDGCIIGRRWDSLHADNNGSARITYRTLHKILRDAGHENTIPRRSAEDDFEEVGPVDPEDLTIEEHERKGPLEKMNDKYWAVMEGGQFKVYWEEEDIELTDGTHKRKRWVRAKTQDFKNMLMNRRVQDGNRTVPIADAWLSWAKRRDAKGVIFDPERNPKGYLNLWTGWSVEPKKSGTWKRLEELLYEVLCDGDQEVFDYVMNWSAYMIQHPGMPAEVAICFQGDKGVGKGTWGRVLSSLAGRHGMHITSSEQLTGRFNDHLRDIIVLFADEAIRPYDKDAESRLKALITEPRLAYEGKGKDVVSAMNRLHIIMASNEDWFVPAGLYGERRFLMQAANTKRKGQHGWFMKLHDELSNGGYSRLMWDLIHRDLGNWAPRQDIPVTQAIIDQKIRNMSPLEQWWYNILMEGRLPHMYDWFGEETDTWSDTDIFVFKQDVRDGFITHCRDNGIHRPGANGRAVDTAFGMQILKLVPWMKTDRRMRIPEDRMYEIKDSVGGNRARVYILPSLEACRDKMDTLLGGRTSWPEAA